MAPKKKEAPGDDAEAPAAKKAKTLGTLWEWKDGSNWKSFDDADMEMLEKNYKEVGSKDFALCQKSFRTPCP